VGPHRADLIIKDAGKRVTDYYSRGQLKLLLCALRLGQMDYLKQHSGKSALVLIDDLPAELDENHRRKLLTLLHGLQNQVFVTATDRCDIPVDEWEDSKVFHVEHGNIEEVV
jgi:DNA replication and repair protein RecF